MSIEIRTSVDILASPARIWAVLTDFGRVPTWNPFIRCIQGALTQGGRLVVQIAPPGKSSMTFKPKLLTVEAERELRWLGHLLVPGLFDGEHAFILRPTADGTRFDQTERFTGVAAPLIMRGSMANATHQGFHAMNVALKREAERI